jgi:uncharacterized membrane protein YedE/YeeE
LIGSEKVIEDDWLMGVLGGLMIGGAGALYLLGNGRIMGASGIFGGLLDGSGKDTARDRLFFLTGLILVPAALVLFTGTHPTNITSDVSILIAAGLLVGIGTRLANGCTSGHGVCWISRLSLRGIVATVIYITAGATTMLVFRHILGII